MNTVYDIDQAGKVLCTYSKGSDDDSVKAVSQRPLKRRSRFTPIPSPSPLFIAVP